MDTPSPSGAKPSGPRVADLFVASLIAAAIVYCIGVAIIAVLVGLTSPAGGLRDAAVFLGFFASMGVLAAAIATFLVVAPLGAVVGAMMLRVTPPRWWQGPITGLLVAAMLIALTLGLLAWSGEPADLGTFAVAGVPLILAPIAGALVQQRFLHWPKHANHAHKT